MLFIFVLFLGVVLLNTSVLADEYRQVLNAYSVGASCFPIISEKKASISGGLMVYLESLVLEDGQRPTDLKIPLLLYRFDDILNFTTLLPIAEYIKGYASNYSSPNLNWDNYFLKDVVDFEENEFILDLYEGYNKIDKKRLYNGYLDAEKKNRHFGVMLPAYESGLYCAYIAPPIDRGIKKMIVQTVVYHSELHSSNMYLSNYCQTKFIIGIGILLAGYLINHILKYKGEKQLDIKNIPIISKAVIFYVLLPFLLFISLEWIVIFIEIHCDLDKFKRLSILLRKNQCGKLRFFRYFCLAYEWIKLHWNILLRFYVLLFSMGYGVIYYNRGASRTFSKMPKRTMNIALSLFIINIVVTNIEYVYKHHITPLKLYQSFAVYKETIDFICMICSTCSSEFPFIWDLTSFFYYYKTKNVIKQLPPRATQTEGIDLNIRIMRAFRNSQLVIAISPLISRLSIISSIIRLTVQSALSLKRFIFTEMNLDVEISSREALINIVKLLNYKMLDFINTKMLSSETWSRAIMIYVTVGLLYMIWIRTNNDLVIEDEKEDLKE